MLEGKIGLQKQAIYAREQEQALMALDCEVYMQRQEDAAAPLEGLPTDLPQ